MNRLGLIALLAGSMMLAAGPASADDAMSNAALDEHRGGLLTPTGLEIGFGASVRTFVDGRLALETQLTWTELGAQTVQTTGAGVAAPLPGAWTELPTLDGRGGVSVLHDLTQDRVASVVINTTNDRIIRQETDITLHLPQLADLQRQIAVQRAASILADAAPR